MARILHLSDTHVSASGWDANGVNSVRALDILLHDLRQLAGLDLVVVSGDVADDGSVDGCIAVRERVEAFAAERKIPHVYSTGNHDDRASFREVLGSGHLSPGGADTGELLNPSDDARAAISYVGGLRVVTLDSLVPGRTFGIVDDRQLSWLRQVLATPSPGGTVIVLHHPPLRFPANPNVERIALQNRDALADVVADQDVRAILCGHLHFQVCSSLARVPVWVSPGVVTRVDTTVPSHRLRGVLGGGASVVDLADPQAPVFQVLQSRDPRAGELVYETDFESIVDVPVAGNLPQAPPGRNGAAPGGGSKRETHGTAPAFGATRPVGRRSE